VKRNSDNWKWHAIIRGGTRVGEDQIGTLHALPGYLVEELHLTTLEGGHVWVSMLTGEASIGGASIIQPVFPWAGFRIPMFFRRWSAKIQGGCNAQVEFRALGYVCPLDGTGEPMIAGIRVWDDKVDGAFNTAWPKGTAAHTASMVMVE
jgi:hypothetical protein